MLLMKLEEKIDRKQAIIGVIGLGYVGLPVAAVFANAGFHVVGVDIKEDRVAVINKGASPIDGREPGLADLLERVVREGRFRATSSYRDLTDCDVILIAVETPVREDHTPGYEALTSVLHTLGPLLKQGALVIVESTVAPGTTEKIVLPILEEATIKKVNQGFFLGHCPERVMPGKLLHNLRYVSRVCGGYTQETAEVMISLYRHIVEGDLDPADCVTAELVKTAENAYRDVNIAFANELAIICEAVGGDVWQVRELVNKSPGRNVLLPGVGVGGHCIPKDPWLLAFGVHNVGDIRLRLIPTAREVNENMPRYVARSVRDVLARAGREVVGARVLILGYAYLENSDDDKNSPSATLVEALDKMGAQVEIHDPHIERFQNDLASSIAEKDAIILAVAHDEYAEMSLDTLADSIVIDARGLWRNRSISTQEYLLLGKGN